MIDVMIKANQPKGRQEKNMIRKFIKSAAAAVSAVSVYSVMTAVSAFAEDAETSSAASGSGSTSGAFLQLVLPLVIMFALLYFIAIRPQKKHEREQREMQENLQIGDEVVTIGGIVGIIVSVSDDTVLIETGGAKNKIRLKNNAISENVTAAERYKAAQAEAKKKKTEGLSSAAVIDDEVKKSKKKKNNEE